MERKITNCEIWRGQERNRVYVGTEGNYHYIIGEYDPNELDINANMFVGLTTSQAKEILNSKYGLRKYA